MATTVSLIADAKTVVKNDLRLLVSDKFDQLNTHIDRLETRVVDLESANTAGHHPIRCETPSRNVEIQTDSSALDHTV